MQDIIEVKRQMQYYFDWDLGIHYVFLRTIIAHNLLLKTNSSPKTDIKLRNNMKNK